MSAGATTELANQARLEAEARHPKVPVFNPADRTKLVSVFGDNYVFSPRAILKIGPKLEWPKDEETQRLMFDRGFVVSAKGTCDAFRMAEEIVKEVPFLVILRGTAEEVEALKEKATRDWVEREYVYVDETIRRWESDIQRFLAENPGMPPPRRGDRVIAAYSWRTKYRTGSFDLERSGNICKLCGWPDEGKASPSELAEHMMHEHPEAPKPVLVEKQKRRGPDSSGTLLIEECGRLGIDLGVADRRGLAAGDEEVIADVKARIQPMVDERAKNEAREREAAATPRAGKGKGKG